MISFAFFGSSRFSTIVLDELNEAGILPQLIVTAPDRPKGRGLRVSGTPVKEWAEAKHIPVLSPESIRDEACSAALSVKKWITVQSSPTSKFPFQTGRREQKNLRRPLRIMAENFLQK